MKSPYTGKKMPLLTEKRKLPFRKQEFDVVFHFYKCDDTGEQFTTTALDELNISQVYNQYREKFNIPFPEEIRQIREQYGASMAKMSAILGFGPNTYRNYEDGDIPTTPNARLIQLMDAPEQFKKMVIEAVELSEADKKKYLKKAEALAEKKEKEKQEYYLSNYLFGDKSPSEYTGYRSPNLSKLTAMIRYFAESVQPYKTKMNKLLFYSDFLTYKRTGYSISGLRYCAINYGPVPNQFQSIYEYLAKMAQIKTTAVHFGEGYSGTQFVGDKELPFQKEAFTSAELEVLEMVQQLFGSATTKGIVEESHKEKAWLENIADKGLINYNLAFEIDIN